MFATASATATRPAEVVDCSLYSRRISSQYLASRVCISFPLFDIESIPTFMMQAIQRTSATRTGGWDQAAMKKCIQVDAVLNACLVS